MNTVDIIVPCYKYAHYLRQCVESLLSQEGVNVRVLIIDDASPDETPAVAQELLAMSSRVQYRRHAENKGHIATFNEGIAWVTADYKLLISADDYLLPGALSRAVALMEAHPEITFAFGRAHEMYPDGHYDSVLTGIGKYDSQEVSIVPGQEFIQASGAKNRVPTPTVVIRAAVLKQMDPYRADLPFTADMDLWLRLAARGAVGIIGAPQAVYRKHATNMSLAYCPTFLPDLRQRKAAFDAFLSACGTQLQDVDGFRQRGYRELATDSMWYARRSLNDGNVDIARQLAEFAGEVLPAIRWTSGWTKLQVRVKLGSAAAGALKAIRPSRQQTGA